MISELVYGPKEKAWCKRHSFSFKIHSYLEWREWQCAHDIRYSWMPEYSNPWELELQAVLGKAVQTLNPFTHDQSFSHSGMFKVLHQLKLP